MKVYLVFLYNNVIVTKTIKKDLNDLFEVQFNGIADLEDLQKISTQNSRTAFGIRVTEKPKSIVVKIYESVIAFNQGSYEDIQLGQVYVPIPEISASADLLDRESNKLEFGARLGNIQLNGIVDLSITWASNTSKSLLDSVQYIYLTSDTKLMYDPLSFHGPAGILNLPKMIVHYHLTRNGYQNPTLIQTTPGTRRYWESSS